MHDKFLVSITHIGVLLPSGHDTVVDHAILLSLHHQGMAHYQHLFGYLVEFLFPPQPALSLCWLMLNLRPTLKPLDLFLCELQASQVSLVLPLCNFVLETVFKALDLLMQSFICLLLTRHSPLSRSSRTLNLSAPPALSHLQI